MSAEQQLELNEQFENQSPSEIIEWVVAQDKKPLVTTSFGPFSAVMLHMATTIKPDMPIVWVDSGYNTEETYLYAQNLIETLKLNIQIFTPEITANRRNALMGGVPDVDSELHEEFTKQVKLEPFQRALQATKPDYWLTAIRKDETDFRKTLSVLGAGPNNSLKVSPFLNWTELDMEEYLYEHELPQVENYYDPTKAEENRECGLHTTNLSA